MTALVGGGVGRHVRQLAEQLVGRGHRVIVACPDQVAVDFEMERTGAHVVAVELGTSGPREVWAAQRRLRALIRGADVVHAHGIRAGAAAAVAGALLRSRPGLVVTSHNAPPAGAAAAVYGALELVVCQGADLVLTVSADLADRARRRGARATAMAVVPSSTAAPASDRDRARARVALHRELGLDEEVPLVLFAGRLAAQKRVDAVVRAHHTLPVGASAPRPVLVVAGDGPLERTLRALAAEGPGEVRFLGHRDDIPELLAGADVVVSSAVWEGQPLVLQEALAAGAPVVATEVGGTAALLGDAGLLVRGDGDHTQVAASVATAVSGLLADPAARAAMTERARARAARLPTTEDAVAAVLQAYRSVAGGRGPRR